MFFTKITNHFMSGNSNGYLPSHHGLNRLRFLNALLGKTPSFRCHSSLLECRANVDTTSLRISSAQKSFNFYLKYHTDCGKLFLLQYNTDAGHGAGNIQSKPMEMSFEHSEISVILRELQNAIKSGMRDKNHITALTMKINSLNIETAVSDLVKLFYFLSMLKVGNQALLMKLSKKIIDRLDEILQPVPLITSYLASIRYLLLRDVESLDKLLTWLCSKDLDLKTIVATLHTLAVVNYFPLNGDIILKKIESASIEKHSTLNQYLNFVWSLVLIDRAEEHMIMKVLDFDFWKKIEYSVPREVQISNFMKLQNIHSYSKKRNIKCHTDMTSMESNNIWINKLKRKREENRDSRCLRELIVHFFPLHTYSLSVVSDSGLIIDAVCYFNKECKPTTEIKNLTQAGSIKLAISILSFHDYCYPDKVIWNGIVEFHKNSLECQGYKILFLSYKHFAKEANLEEKCKSLCESIQNILPNFKVDDFSR